MALSIRNRQQQRSHQQRRINVRKALALLFMNLHGSIVVAMPHCNNLR